VFLRVSRKTTIPSARTMQPTNCQRSLKENITVCVHE
jgi:hypothetical protein